MHGILADRLLFESGERSLLRDALFRALSSFCGLDLVKRGSRSMFRTDKGFFKFNSQKLVKATGRLNGDWPASGGLRQIGADHADGIARQRYRQHGRHLRLWHFRIAGFMRCYAGGVKVAWYGVPKKSNLTNPVIPGLVPGIQNWLHRPPSTTTTIHALGPRDKPTAVRLRVLSGSNDSI